MTHAIPPNCVVVTGASSGIGQALALAYAGPNVMLGLIGRNAERLQASAQACRARGAQVSTGGIDVCDAQALKTWLDAFDASHPIDLLIANAGIDHILDGLDDWEDLACITKIVDTNLYGTVHTVLPVIERMRARKRGQIAMVASLAALRGMSITPAYSASKAAIKVWADAIRPLIKRHGIALSVVMPGWVETPMSAHFQGDRSVMWSAERAAAYIQRKLAAGHGEIAFPFFMQAGMRLLPLLPIISLADLILNKMSFPPEGKN